MSQTADLSAERRSELAAFLKSRRDRLTPEELGLVPGPRRRTPGLRREEVAQLAGIGVTWYTWLEQGRSIKVSEQVLDSVARTLKLDAAERAHLFNLASVPVPTEPEPEEPIAERLQMMLDKLHPYPAQVLNGKFDVLAYNKALTKLHANWDNVPPEDHNVIWWNFKGRENGCLMLDWDQEVPWVVATLRATYANHVGEPAWEQFIERMCDNSKMFAKLWQSQDVAHSTGRTKRFMHKDLGLISFDTMSYRPVGMSESRVIVYTPSDDETAEKIQAWI